MKKKPLKPPVPVERRETIRQAIAGMLEDMVMSAKEISIEAAISERDVYEHLEHIRRTACKGEYRFVALPPVCKKCGFEFRKREKLKKPGRCPVCRSETIQDPMFSIKKNRQQ